MLVMSQLLKLSVHPFVKFWDYSVIYLILEYIQLFDFCKILEFTD